MILVIDNYDSFTYNLVQYLGELAGERELAVYRNDQVTPAEVVAMKPECIVLSPGPGHPDDAGICPDLVRMLQGVAPLLGVCLGHQVLGRVFGGNIKPATRLMHGKTSSIEHNGEGLFAGIGNHFSAARYHSLVVDPCGLPSSLEVTATAEDGEIMGLKHRVHPYWGIQFHPESILTAEGKRIVANFLKREVLENENHRGDSCSVGSKKP